MLTNTKEDPLKHFAVVVGVLRRVKPEDMILVVVLCQVKQDRGSLKDSEIATGMVDNSRNATIRVQLDKPRLLKGHQLRAGDALAEIITFCSFFVMSIFLKLDHRLGRAS